MPVCVFAGLYQGKSPSDGVRSNPFLDIFVGVNIYVIIKIDELMVPHGGINRDGADGKQEGRQPEFLRRIREAR